MIFDGFTKQCSPVDAKPVHVHDCDCCTYHGTVVIGNEAVDVYTHRNAVDDCGVVLRMSDEPSDYRSFTVPTESALAADLADDEADTLWWEQCEAAHYASLGKPRPVARSRPKLPGGPLLPGGRPGARMD